MPSEYIRYERIEELYPTRKDELRAIAICIDKRGLHLPMGVLASMPRIDPRPTIRRLKIAKIRLKEHLISWPGMIESNKTKCATCPNHDPLSAYKPGCTKLKSCGCDYQRTVASQPTSAIINGRLEIVSGCPEDRFDKLQFKGST